MPEESGEMPVSPEVSSSSSVSFVEKAANNWGDLPFNRVIEYGNRLKKSLEEPRVRENEKLSERYKKLVEKLEKRRDKLINDLKKKGLLDLVERRLQLLEKKGKNLTPDDLRKEHDFSLEIDDRLGISKDDVHYGALGWCLREGLKKFEEALPSSGEIQEANKGENLTSLTKKIERGEPEIERIPIPETAGECIATAEDRLFNLLNKAISEGKGTKNYSREYEAIERFIKRIPSTPEYRGKKDQTLSKYLYSRFPEGVFLREKLILLYEAMKNLTDRMVEVEDSGGSLLKLGVEKPDVALAKELQLGFTNIRPVDWYVLSHLDDLFPESENIPETRIYLQEAWDMWRSVGDLPYVCVERKSGSKRRLERKRDEDQEKKWVLRIILRRNNNGNYEIVRREDAERLARERLGEVDDNKWAGVEDGDDKYKHSGEFTLKDFYQSESVERYLRAEIIRRISEGVSKNEIAATRSELLAYCFLRVGLTFDLWDRERWKVTEENQARDLIWFPFKQIEKLIAGRSGGGVLETAGAYWALEGQSEKVEKIKKDKKDKRERERYKEIYDTLKENEEHCIFFLPKGKREVGTVIGDFWSSVLLRDRSGNKFVLKERKLKEIPWLDPESGIEEKTYQSYFEYSMKIAADVVSTLLKTEWKPEDCAREDFWQSRKDLFVRIKNFCPFFLRLEKEGNRERIQWIEKFINLYFARGIFWIYSYKAQPKEYSFIPKERKGIITLTEYRKIMGAIWDSGFLDKEFIEYLNGYCKKFGIPSRLRLE